MEVFSLSFLFWIPYCIIVYTTHLVLRAMTARFYWVEGDLSLLFLPGVLGIILQFTVKGPLPHLPNLLIGGLVVFLLVLRIVFPGSKKANSLKSKLFPGKGNLDQYFRIGVPLITLILYWMFFPTFELRR